MCVTCVCVCVVTCVVSVCECVVTLYVDHPSFSRLGTSVALPFA